MAKEKLNQIKKPKKPLREVLFQLLKKLIYLLIVLSIARLIYVFDNSNLLEPKISWDIDGDLATQTYQYDELIEPLLSNKYFINLSKLKDKVEEYPWVEKASVQRIFWNRIRVTIKNHDIAMKWGSEGYISSSGVLFKPNFSIISVNCESTFDDFLERTFFFFWFNLFSDDSTFFLLSADIW